MIIGRIVDDETRLAAWGAWTTRRRANRVCRSRKGAARMGGVPGSSGSKRSMEGATELCQGRKVAGANPAVSMFQCFKVQYFLFLSFVCSPLCLHDLPLALISIVPAFIDPCCIPSRPEIRRSPSRSTVHVTPHEIQQSAHARLVENSMDEITCFRGWFYQSPTSYDYVLRTMYVPGRHSLSMANQS